MRPEETFNGVLAQIDAKRIGSLGEALRTYTVSYFSQFKNHGWLVLLCHIFLRRGGFAIGALQHGHRGRLLTSARISRRRMVAIEFGM
jgi:hypothetical protein